MNTEKRLEELMGNFWIKILGNGDDGTRCQG